jgi:hypothetical protein
MDMDATLRTLWTEVRDRLADRQLLRGDRASISLRIAGGDGAMWFGTADLQELAPSLRAGGNALPIGGVPVCLGTTGSRLALNAELFEKCAKACVLAAAPGGPVKPLPWWVRHIANGRLLKDEARAAACFTQGRLPEESRGY